LKEIPDEAKNLLSIQYASGDNCIGFKWNGVDMLATIYQVRATYTNVKEDETVNESSIFL
jgi:hypothetical protein